MSQICNVLQDLILVKSGLRKGDAVSPIVFNTVIEKVIREINIKPQEGVKVQGLSIELLVDADDVVFMEE